MNILVIGSGGREHALAWKLAQSEKADKIYVAPGNAGTQEDFTNVALDVMDFDALIEFSKENELLDTGGGIKKASHFFNDHKPFLIHNVDILSNINLNEFYNKHESSNSVASLVCSERQTSRYLLFNKNNHLKGWINKTSGEVKSPISKFNPNEYKELAFSGIHIMNTSILKEMIEYPDKFSIIDFYLSICNHKPITAYRPSDSRMIDVGKLDSLEIANNFLF